MPIDIEAAKAAQLTTHAFSWDADRAILYHLGIGAGADHLNPKELAYTYEKHLKVLPTFAVIPTYPTPFEVTGLPCMEFSKNSVLHGEHEIEIFEPLATHGDIVTRSRVLEVFDRGSGAFIVIENRSYDKATDRPLFVNRWGLFVVGQGGFGGEAGPKSIFEMPQRKADAMVESPILSQLPQIFRLSGDKVLIHIDPDAAAAAKLGQPIVHGLCTFGVVCKAMVDTCLEGDVNRVRRFKLRFAKPLYPGDTVVTSIWRDGRRLIATAASKAQGHAIATQCVLEFDGE